MSISQSLSALNLFVPFQKLSTSSGRTFVSVLNTISSFARGDYSHLTFESFSHVMLDGLGTEKDKSIGHISGAISKSIAEGEMEEKEELKE